MSRIKIVDLPIDVIPDTLPLRFRWKYVMDTISGPRSLDQVGCLPPTVEDAVLDLIKLTKRQAQEIEELRKELKQFKSQPVQPPPPASSSTKKSKS